jgi:hypothetical protein
MKIPMSIVIAGLLAGFAFEASAKENGPGLTTQEAAEAKKREGQTGTSNKNAAKQLKQLEKEEKESYQPKPNPSSTPKKVVK